MKSTKKIIIILLCTGLVTGSAVAGEIDWASLGIPNTTEISDSVNDFTSELTTAIPQVATQQDIWADAYIGKLFPSAIVHLGGGINIGATHIDTSGLKKAADEFAIDNVPASFYMPTIDADLRIGGIVLPFDIGINIMKTNTLEFSGLGANLGLDFFTIGIDGRYAVLKGNAVLPTVSIGAGYVYSQGDFAVSNEYANIDVDYKTQTAYLSAQISKPVLLFTPFLGLRALVSSSDNNWSWAVTDDTLKTLISASNLVGADNKDSDSGSVSTNGLDFSALQPQVYAGCGFNFLFMQATLSVTADLRNIADKGLWSGAFSLRAKL